MLKKCIRGQVSNEFLILLGVAFFFLLMFLSLIADEIGSVSYNKERASMRDLAFSVRHEIMIASDVMDGYERTIMLPDRVNSHDYTVANTDVTLSFISTNKNIEESLLIPSVVGNFTKGWNTIRKSGGVVYIN